MKGLLLKDYFNLQGTMKVYLLFPILIAFFTYMNESMGMIPMLIAFFSIITLMNSFAYDEMSDFETYVLTLPLRKKDIVKSKFMLANISTLFGLGIGFVIAMLVYIMKKNSFPDFVLSEFLISSFITACVMLIINCIFIPLIFRYGTMKARIAFVLCFLIIGFGGNFILHAIGDNIAINSVLMERLYTFFPYLGIIFVILCEGISYLISCNILMKKEF